MPTDYIQSKRQHSRQILADIAASSPRMTPASPAKAERAQEIIIAAKAAQANGQHLPEIYRLELQFLARMLTGYMPDAEAI